MGTPPPPMVMGENGGNERGTRLWMRFDRNGATKVEEYDKNTIIKRASLPAKDLRILGPLFSQSSNILSREKAILINLEILKAVITAEEVLLLDPLCPEVLTLVDRLKQQFPQKKNEESIELPFEFQVFEIVLEIVCLFLNSNVAALETEAWYVLDELTKNVNTENLDNVRCFKTKLTCLLLRVQKVKDEIEHLLDDNEYMADLYLTRKWIQGTASTNRSASMVKEDDVEDLEMLLEAYFKQLEAIRSKILNMRGHIENTEDYVKIQQSDQRNKLIKLKLTLIIAAFAIAAPTLLVSLLGMNIPISLYNTNGVFGYVVWSVAALCVVLFIGILCYARSKKLLGS